MVGIELRDITVQEDGVLELELGLGGVVEPLLLFDSFATLQIAESMQTGTDGKAISGFVVCPEWPKGR
jgi:hypothetical protein